MKIEKGQKYLCTADYYFTNKCMWYKGKVYEAVADDLLRGEISTYCSAKDIEIFQPLSSAKWAIKRAPENAEVVNRWANETPSKNGEEIKRWYQQSGYMHYPKMKIMADVEDGYTEIDFETFKEITGMGEEKPKQLLGEKEAVHCPTLELAEKVIDIFKHQGIDVGRDDYWNGYREDSVFDIDNMNFSFCDIGWYERNGYEIISAEQFIKDNEQKIFTIEDVRNGKCAIENDGTVEELKKVIDNAFIGESTEFIIGFHFDKEKYYAKANEANDWIPYSETNLPTQSVKLFLSQMEGEKEQVWEVGDFVYENWEGCPDPNTAYKITNVEDDKVFYNRTTDSWGKKNVLKLVKSRDVFSKTTTECQSGDLEEWQPKAENEFSPKWGEEVEVSDDGRDWLYAKFIGRTIHSSNIHAETVHSSHTIWAKYRKPKIHTFTTEKAKQDLAKLHNINVNQIKIVE